MVALGRHGDPTKRDADATGWPHADDFQESRTSVASRARCELAGAATTMKPREQEKLLQALETRFENNMRRHGGIAWASVRAKLEGNPGALRSLREMEATGGEPDVIGQDDGEALESRKENKPANSAVEMAAAMGIDLLTEEQYRDLQKLGDFDTKTSSWVRTPSEVRALGGALFCDRRYGKIFLYHNGAQSYYAARGFRGSLRV